MFAFVQKVVIEDAKNRKQVPFKVGIHERSLRVDEPPIKMAIH